MVYNHEPYLRQCLDGFVMQKTNFKFEAVVHDDASTDGSADIIREYAEKYPEIIKPIYETENQYSKKDGSLEMIMFSACRGKYIAFCEGDDYWIEPDKLQIQVEYMTRCDDIGLCYTKTNYWHEENQRFLYEWGGPSTSFMDLLKVNTIPTLTVLCRSEFYPQYIKEISPFSKSWLMGDYPMWLWLSHRYKVCFIDKVTSVYRVLNESASHSTNVEKKLGFILSCIDIQEFFSNQYNMKSGLDYAKLRIQTKMYNYALYGKWQSFVANWKVLIKFSISNIFCLFPFKYMLFFIFPKLRRKYLIH